MVEDDDVVVGLEDGIALDHAGLTVAYHTAKGDVGRELELRDASADDLGVASCYELDDLGIVHEREAGDLPRLLPQQDTVDVACRQELLIDERPDIEAVGQRDVVDVLLLGYGLVDLVALGSEAGQDVGL